MSPGVRIAGMRVSVHPGVLVLVAAALYAHLGTVLAVYAVVLLGHELAHLLAAAAFDLTVASVEVLPFGGVARVEGLELADPGVEAAVALAGPLHNLLCLAGGFVLREAGWLQSGTGSFFLAANAALALGNLLPALPLDGGRVARAALALRHGTVAATRWVTRLGVWTGVGLCAAGCALLPLGVFAPGLFVFGVFVLLRVRRSEGVDGMRPWRELAGRRAALRVAGLLPVQHLAADAETPLRVVVGRLVPRREHLLWLVDEHGHLRGPWDEQHIWEAFRARGADVRAGELGRPPATGV